MKLYALIIAGGVGARFWPRSRERSPKQLLDIVGAGTMIQNTVYRLDPLIPAENVLVVTNAVQAAEIHRQLPRVPRENILVEPAGRNTAPAIAFGAEVLRHRVGDAVMVVVPADHLVHDVVGYQDTLKRAIRTAVKTRGLVTLGIRPTHPETGYGYIQYDDRGSDSDLGRLGAHPVKTFAEKPNLETAKMFLESGDFLWNSGMFIFKVKPILNAFAEFLPDVTDEFRRLRPLIDTPGFAAALETAYRGMRSISIDYGVMEKAENRYILPSEFGWNDLGSWDEAYRVAEKDGDENVIVGTVFARDTRRCHISTTAKRVVAAIGVEDLSIIDTDDAVLVCRRGRSQEVKDIVDLLKKQNLKKHL
ncbi:MAG: mannose-1-phosphate guanylyltransferase [Ignavibacteriae bacterium]|nr:mannose-1-phosphate guanylyltransferase [Ignavibacteriota bacterium]